MIALPVMESSQVAEARRQAVAAARRLGFDETDAGRAAIVATELGTNLVKHAGGGEILIGEYEDPTGSGVEILSIDRGRGMERVGEAMRDGHSTAGSSGEGLGSVRRQSQAFDIASWPGLGTVVLSRIRAGRHAPRSVDPVPRFGGLAVPKAGETACGDAWTVAEDGPRLRAMMADGLGHGVLAAEASATAVAVFRKDPACEPVAMLGRLHEGLRATRGAAVAVALLDPEAETVTFGGIGNIAGFVAGPSGQRRMVSHNGTAGLSMQRSQSFVYPLPAEALVVLHSDGLASSCSLDRYPGLGRAHPVLVAAVLYRDFSRGRDDSSVLVMRGGMP